MIKILRTVAVLGSVGCLAGLAMAQDKQSEAFGSDVSAVLAKLEAQCAHRRRTMPPDDRDDCTNKLNKLRADAQLGSGQDGASVQASGAGPGNAGGQGNGIGLGVGGGRGNGIGLGVGGGGGQGKGGR